MSNTKIFSEAIAEAKSIRETAMANAKLALEEAFAPRMQEMMANKLESLAEEMEEEDLEEGTQEGGIEEISLEELIAELDSLEETADNDADDTMEEGAVTEEGVIAEDAEEDDEVGTISVDELKDIFREVMKEFGAEEEEGEEEEQGEEGEEAGEEEAGEEDELNLEEILAELDSNLNENLEETETLEEGDLDEALANDVKALAAKYGKSFEKWIDSVGNKIHGGKGLGLTKGETVNEEELAEAMTTIATLRSELNEVNLLNAKLLYVNKLFKAKNLTEAQKVKVISAFDRAETVREAKNVFETLTESLAAVKNPIKESLSFASKAAGVAPSKQPIVENDDFMLRMQKIAGII
jgi:hypothetical protein